MIKKLIGVSLALLFFVCIASADNSQVYETYVTTYSVTNTTATALPCELAYVILHSTGTSTTVTLYDGGTSKVVLGVPAYAGSLPFDFTRAPIKFSTSLNFTASTKGDTGAYITLIYKRGY